MTEMKQEQIVLAFDENLAPDDWRLLKTYADHFREFWENFEDLRSAGLASSWNMSSDEDGVVSCTDLGVSRHRLKGFLTDYRKFHQQSEPIQFNKICNLLARKCKSKALHRQLEKEKSLWNDPKIPILGWHNEIGVSDFVETLFNEEVFHTGIAKRTELRMSAVRVQLSETAIWAVAFFAAYERLLVLRNLNWIARPAIENQNAVRIPVRS